MFDEFVDRVQRDFGLDLSLQLYSDGNESFIQQCVVVIEIARIRVHL